MNPRRFFSYFLLCTLLMGGQLYAQSPVEKDSLSNESSTDEIAVQDTLLPQILTNPEPFVKTFEPFTSVDGRFTIFVPGEPKHNQNTIETDIGEIVYHTYLYQPPEPGADNFVYMISYCDYPEHTIHSDSTNLLDDFFQETMESAAFSINGDLMYSAPTTYKDFPGRIFRVHYKNGKASIKSKAFLINNRFYNIQAISLSDKKMNMAADKFLESFKVYL